MTAPDKLYIEIDNKAHVYFGLQPESAVEYIRKDALMEWAKGEIMPGNSAEGKGWNWALQTLIEKIEKL